MPIKRAIEHSGGVFTPEDLKLLQRVFEMASNPEYDDEQRDRCASRIVANFEAGIRDENELISLSRLPLGR